MRCSVRLPALLVTAGAVALAIGALSQEAFSFQQEPSTYEKMFADPGFVAREAGFSDSEKVGRRIWLYATAGNDRFHTYVFQQRLGVLIDWHRVLDTEARDERFSTWGLINDPDCCTPGDPDCPARSKDETYGFDWCIGDDELLDFVGRDGYRDPACDLVDAAAAADDPHASQRQDPCDLAFGTSTGALGLRKFPNPRFDAAAWRGLNADYGGGLGTWEGYRQVLEDGSVEPPFLIGMACSACHIAFDPLNPPSDPSHPEWENLLGTVGNQYARFSEIMASGMPMDTLEWQIFSHARPGTVDTSAVPNDGVNNPGTMNAIINFGRRPLYEHEILKWRRVQSCPAGAADSECWCEPGKPGKCWERGVATERVPNILKGGEDSIGVLEAIQRVYINIGSCSEQAWVNHLLDLRQADPEQRLFRQTPFDIGQARRDCANFRAIEDRLEDIANFLLTARPSELWQARGLGSRAELVTRLDREFGAGAVARGRDIFAAECARCHASPEDGQTLTGATPLAPVASRDFWAEDPANPGLRLDWMGSDRLVSATQVGTYPNRALHSNHMDGHVWAEYGSETLRRKEPVSAEGRAGFLPDIVGRRDGGRGYYRVISLLSLWAHAPFTHNNAIGPELCGPAPDDAWRTDVRRNLYRSPYVQTDAQGGIVLDDNGNPALTPNPPPCRPYDPSVEGRYELFKESMRQMLNPDTRIPKITTIAENIHLPIGPGGFIRDNDDETSLEVVIPAGTPAVFLANLAHKELIGNLVLARTDRNELRDRLAALWGGQGDAATIDDMVAEHEAIIEELVAISSGAGAQERIDRSIEVVRAHRPLIQRLYSRGPALIENGGHRFGADLTPEQKDALIAFLATL